MNPNYPLVAERAGHRCEYCRAPEAVFNMPFEVEHIIPRDKEGLNVASNLALACRSCNLNKSNHIEGIDPITQELAPLFHPRKDKWAEHFTRDQLFSFNLRGLTPIGRATISQLRMNSPLQLAARERWSELQLFP